MDIIPPERAVSGRFQKGTSGNPGGRPALAPDVKKALEAASERAASRLVELIESDDPRVALMASNSVLDRLYGKPAQTVDAKVQTTDVGAIHLQILQEIAERRKERLASSPPGPAGH